METIPGPWRPVTAVRRIHCSNVRGMSGNFSDLTVKSSQYDTLLWSETLVSDMHYVSDLLVPGIGCPVLLCRGMDSSGPKDTAHSYVRDGCGTFCTSYVGDGC